jgi:hypothetical protein
VSQYSPLNGSCVSVLIRASRRVSSGNVKWSSLEVDTRDRNEPRVNYELWVDGKLAWQ